MVTKTGKTKKSISLFLLISVVVAIFAVMVLAFDAPEPENNNVAVHSPRGNYNISGIMLLNVSNASMANVTNVTFMIMNFTDAQNGIISQFVVNGTDRATNLSFSTTTNTAVSQAGLRDGRYNISVKAYNASDNRILGNNSSLRGAIDGGTFFTIDNTFPEVRGYNESDRVNYTANQNITVRVTLTNNTGDSSSGTEIHKVRFQITYANGSSNNLTEVWMKNVTGLTANIYNVTWNATINRTSEGNHTVKVFVNDTAGNANFTQNATFLVDLTAPTTSLLNLSEFANISKSNITFQWNTTDTWASSMTCQLVVNKEINVTDLTVSNGTAGGSSTLQNSRTFADGFNNVSVMCNDTVRLQNITMVTNFTVDTAFPEVRGYNESDRVNYTANQNITVRVTLTNNTGSLVSGTEIHKVRFQITYANGSSNNLTEVWMKNVTGLTANIYNVTWNATINRTSEGNHTVKVFVNDTAGNANFTQNATFLVDLTAPTTSLLNISESANISKSNITFQWNTTDTWATSMVCQLVINSNINVTDLTVANGTAGGSSTLQNSRTFADGFNNISVMCNDTVRLQNITMVTNFTVDTIAVDIQSVAIGKRVPVADSVRLNVTTGDNITFNASVQNLSGTHMHTVIFQVANGTNSSGSEQFFNLTAGANLNDTNGTVVFYAASVSGLNLEEGNNTVIVFSNDTAGNMNNSRRTNLTFLVDKRAPTVIQLYNLTENYNSSDTTPWFVWQVNDSFSPTMVCELYINSTLNVSKLNVTNGTSFSFEAGKALPQGKYNWSVSCNDSVNIMNSSHVRNITIDTSGPSVSLSKSASSSTSLTVAITATADSLACTSSRGAATVTGAPGASQTLTETGLTAGTSYTYVVSCTDTSGNVASGSITLSTDAAAASSGGSGSGGSGGGISSGTTGQSEKKTWASILAGEKASVAVTNGVLGVTSIEFVVEKTTYGATMQVKKVDTLPSSIKAFSEKKYKTLDISQTNVEKALSGNAIINFKVEKKWLADNNLASNAIVMFHYKDNAWVELKTTVGQDDGTYVHYTAETSGFSYFIIGEKSGVAAPLAEKKAAPSAAPTSVTEPSEAVAEEVTAEEPSSGSAAVWVVVGLVLVGLLAWVVMALRRRR